MSQAERYILIGLVAIFIVVFLRWLKHYLRRNEILESFPYVYPFGKSTLNGKEILIFELPSSDTVKAEVLSSDGGVVLFLFESKLRPGKHEQVIDLSSLPYGNYQVKITFSNQVTTRSIRIG